MIEFKNVSKHFGPTQVLHDISLKINQGEVVVIIGPSGSGKSTMLRCINKLEEITSGDLIVDGLKVNDPKVDERLIRQEAGMVFQQFYLFPHLTALENVMFGPLRVRGASKQAAEKQAKELLAKVGLAERAHHYPSELSGGQQQRVAIARALAVKPKMTTALSPTMRAAFPESSSLPFRQRLLYLPVYVATEVPMPWILLLLAALFTAPLSAATLPGVPTANTDKNSASEPDVEQKRAAYAALADVLANDSARQELIDQLRKAAATPPPDSTPTLTPPAVKEETTVLENAAAPDHRRGVYHRPAAAGANPVCRSAAKRSPEWE